MVGALGCAVLGWVAASAPDEVRPPSMAELGGAPGLPRLPEPYAGPVLTERGGAPNPSEPQLECASRGCRELRDGGVVGAVHGFLVAGAGFVAGVDQDLRLGEPVGGRAVWEWLELVMLVRIPYDRTAERVAALLARKMQTLPEFLRKSITWDQGKEMAEHAQFTIKTGIEVYFCDPH
jgi:hypothetical protein